MVEPTVPKVARDRIRFGPAVTARYLQPDQRALLEAGSAFSAWWSQSGPNAPTGADVVPMAPSNKTGLTCMNRSGPLGRADRI